MYNQFKAHYIFIVENIELNSLNNSNMSFS